MFISRHMASRRFIKSEQALLEGIRANLVNVISTSSNDMDMDMDMDIGDEL